MELDILPERFAICRLAPQLPIPGWADGPLLSVTRTREELSIVCEETRVPHEVQAERGRHALKVKGPIPFALTGVLDSLAAPLTRAGISIFALSTYDTDYLFVAAQDLPDAVAALQAAGHIIHESGRT